MFCSIGNFSHFHLSLMFARLFLGQGDSKLACYTLPLITVSSVPFPDLDFSRKKIISFQSKLLRKKNGETDFGAKTFILTTFSRKGLYLILS
jgi:hypothetical protein